MRQLTASTWFPIIAILFGGSAHAQTKDLWEIRMETSAPGLPAGSSPAKTARSCVARGENPFRMGQQSQGCAVNEQEKTSDGWRWKLTCEGGVSGTGRIKFLGTDAYEGESQMNVPGQTITSKFSGKRVGPC